MEVELWNGVDIVSIAMVEPSQMSTTFSSLQPLTNYSLTVYVRSGVGRSDPATVHISTFSLSKSHPSHLHYLFHTHMHCINAGLPQPTISTFQPISSSELLVQWEVSIFPTPISPLPRPPPAECSHRDSHHSPSHWVECGAI